MPLTAYQCQLTPHSRRKGHSATAAAAYRAGDVIEDQRTGEVHDYSRRSGVEHAEIFVPDNAPAWARNRAELWNASELANTRKNSTVDREFRITFPAQFDADERRAAGQQFAHDLVDKHGVAVDLSWHFPDRDGDQRNYHGHVLFSTRRLGEDGFTEKTRELDARPSGSMHVRHMKERWATICADMLHEKGESVLAERWRHGDKDKDVQMRLATERGDFEFVRENDITLPTIHMGPEATHMERKGIATERGDLNREIAEENARRLAEREAKAAEIQKDPSILLDEINRTEAVFDRRDMARSLNRYIDDPDQFQGLLARMEQDKQLVQLSPERTEGRRTIPAQYSTRDMIDTEDRLLHSAKSMAATPSHHVDSEHVQAAIARAGTLSDEQRHVVERVTAEGRFAGVVGDAGTGKSFAMNTAREAWEAQGYRVRGAALAGKAADELQGGSGIESRTLHSLEYSWDQGRDTLTDRDVLVIDEAGMVGSRQLARVMERADKAGAKVVMLGDSKQLSPIEAGAGFRAITERTGASEITEIRRQRDSWAREASGEFARGDVRTALDAYQERGGVRMVDTREDAKAAIASDYLADRQMGGTSTIMAHSNKDVQAMNRHIREARKEAGELGASTEIETARGRREFAEGDRIVFLKNNRDMAVKNGTLGTVQGVSEGQFAVQLDNGRRLTFDSRDYDQVDHGYALTIHKEQGVTVDRAYVLATPGMDRSLAYVGMTRHRESATMYAGGDDFASYDKLAKNLSRERPKESTLDFAERHGVEVDAGQWSVAKLDPERAQALRDAIAQRPAEDAQGPTSATAEQPPGRNPRVDLSRLEGAEQTNTAATPPAEKPALSPTQQKAREQQQRMFAELKAHKAEQGQQADPEARRQKAVQLAAATMKRQAEKAGKTVSPDSLRQMEKAAAERLERDPKMVDRVLQMGERQQQAGERPAQREAQGGEAAAGGRGQKFDFEKLREQNAEGVKKQEQERSQGHERGGPELER